MFKILLAFLVWLFATGKYQDWLALATKSGASGSTSGASSGGMSSLLGSIGSLGSLTGNSAQDSQLLGPMGYSPADSGVPK